MNTVPDSEVTKLQVWRLRATLRGGPSIQANTVEDHRNVWLEPELSHSLSSSLFVRANKLEVGCTLADAIMANGRFQPKFMLVETYCDRQKFGRQLEVRALADCSRST